MAVMQEKKIRASNRPAYGEGRMAVVTAAIRLVARDGLGKMTYRSLATEANITTGVVQHHFGSIYNVLESALEYCIELSKAYAEGIDTVDSYIDAIQTFLKDDPELAAFQVELFLAGRTRPKLTGYLAKLQESYRSITRGALHASGVAYDENLIEFITVTLDGITFQAVALGEEDHQRERMEQQFLTLKRVVALYSPLAR